jgi:hypothetical protein
MAGRFATPIGLEVLEPWGNPHVSRSWGWTAQPINHDGVGLSGSADIVDWSIAAANSYFVNDFVQNDIDDEKAVLGSLGAAVSDELNVYVSGIWSQDGDFVDRWLANLILSGNMAAGDGGLRYALEGNWRNDDPDVGSDATFKNIAAYVGTDVGPVGLDVRVDYTDDEGIVSPIEADIWSVTVTGSIPLASGVAARLEYRHDGSDEDIFGDGGSTEDTLDLIMAQIVWHPESN